MFHRHLSSSLLNVFESLKGTNFGVGSVVVSLSDRSSDDGVDL